MATLLPNGKQQFIDPNGNPLASGLVYFYIPSTTTPKDTWQDSGQSTANTNPIILDASGEAVIYGSGIYRQAVYDSSGNLIWDQLTASTDVGGLAWGGTSTGSANAQVIAASTFSGQDGQTVAFIAGLTNTSAMTITLGDGALPIAVLRDTLTGPSPLIGNEVVAGNAVMMIYEQARGAFHLVEYPQVPGFGLLVNTAGGSTISLGARPTHNVLVTGSGWTCTSFGSASILEPIYMVYFSGTGTITNSGTLICPGNADIAVGAGDCMMVRYLTGVTWQIIQYQRQAAPPTSGYTYLNRQVFTTNGTYTPTTGARRVNVQIVGPGGGGGGADSNGGGEVSAAAAGGGGAGEYASADFLLSNLTATVSVTVPSGASGGTVAGTNGSNGSTTSFGAYLTAVGGNGGTGVAVSTTFVGGEGGTGGSGGSSSGSPIALFRNNGGDGSPGTTGDGGAGSALINAMSGTGGASFFGGGGRGRVTNNSQLAGGAGRGYGSGGGGAAAKTATGAAGGDGNGGIAIVTEYA